MCVHIDHTHSLIIINYTSGKPMKLSENAEEAATFFGKMLDHDYTKKDIFCKNFFADWRKVSGALFRVGQ